MRTSYVFRNGKLVEVGSNEYYGENVAPAVITDTLEQPLRHPVTSKMHTSKSAFRAETKALGYQEVGTELLSQKKQVIKETLTEDKIMSAIHRAEAIHSDPSRAREWQNMNMERYERHMKALSNK